MTYYVARPAQLWCRSNDLADRAWPANILKAKVPFDDGAVFHPHDHSALQSQTIRVRGGRTNSDQELDRNRPGCSTPNSWRLGPAFQIAVGRRRAPILQHRQSQIMQLLAQAIAAAQIGEIREARGVTLAP